MKLQIGTATTPRSFPVIIRLTDRVRKIHSSTPLFLLSGWRSAVHASCGFHRPPLPDVYRGGGVWNITSIIRLRRRPRFPMASFVLPLLLVLLALEVGDLFRLFLFQSSRSSACPQIFFFFSGFLFTSPRGLLRTASLTLRTSRLSSSSSSSIVFLRRQRPAFAFLPFSCLTSAARSLVKKLLFVLLLFRHVVVPVLRPSVEGESRVERSSTQHPKDRHPLLRVDFVGSLQLKQGRMGEKEDRPGEVLAKPKVSFSFLALFMSSA